MTLARILKLAYRFDKIAISLESDMAKRIMLSIIPSFTNPGENQATYGLPDFTVLSSAVKGAERILKYGTMACVKEMYYFGETWNNNLSEDDHPDSKYAKARKAVDDAENALKKGDRSTALRICAESFDNVAGWAALFGGKKWAKIAKTLIQIDSIYTRLSHMSQATPEQKEDPKFYENQREAMREIVLYMNVFDGLAHNSGSIYDKMLSYEEEEKGSPGNLLNVEHMMHAKELNNPVDVYRQIEDTLQTSEDQYGYRDWVRKVRNHPDYRNYSGRSETVEARIRMIAVKKGFMNLVDELNDACGKLRQVGSNFDFLSKSDRQQAVKAITAIKANTFMLNQRAQAVRTLSTEIKAQILAISTRISKLGNPLWEAFFMQKRPLTSEHSTQVADLISNCEQLGAIVSGI